MEPNLGQMANMKLQTVEIYEKVLEQQDKYILRLEKIFREMPPQDEHVRNSIQVQLDQLILKQNQVYQELNGTKYLRRRIRRRGRHQDKRHPFVD